MGGRFGYKPEVLFAYALSPEDEARWLLFLLYSYVILVFFYCSIWFKYKKKLSFKYKFDCLGCDPRCRGGGGGAVRVQARGPVRVCSLAGGRGKVLSFLLDHYVILVFLYCSIYYSYIVMIYYSYILFLYCNDIYHSYIVMMFVLRLLLF